MQVLPVRQQFALMEETLRHRLATLLPRLMEETGIDAWVVLTREYNEDPVFRSLVPPKMRTARRLNCFVYVLENKEVLCYNAGKPYAELGDLYIHSWQPEQESQFGAVGRILRQHNPRVIGVNTCHFSGMSDGLSQALYEDFLRESVPGMEDRVTSAQYLAIRWLETRLPEELERYPAIYRVSESILDELYSLKTIIPGVTTTDDLEWLYAQKCSDRGLPCWFQPHFDLIRPGMPAPQVHQVIHYGDLLHCDLGLVYLGLCTDTQRMAYLPHPGQQPPIGLFTAYQAAVRFQDITTSHMVPGRTGNEILSGALQQARQEGLEAVLYTHPIGVYGHSAGPTIGLTDNQVAVPFRGEIQLHEDTCYALELNATALLPEWGQKVCFRLEETIAVTRAGVHYLGDRTKDLTIIR